MVNCMFHILHVLLEMTKPIFLWSAPVAFRRVALETPEWTSRDSNHHRQSVSAGKTNAIPTEPSGRLLEMTKPNNDILFVFFEYFDCTENVVRI